MKRSEIIHDEGPHLGAGEIDELVGMHAKRAMSLAWDLTTSQPRAAVPGGDDHQLVTELLRLARIGAIAEAEAKSDGAKPVRVVVADARRRWRIELGIV